MTPNADLLSSISLLARAVGSQDPALQQLYCTLLRCQEDLQHTARDLHRHAEQNAVKAGELQGQAACGPQVIRCPRLNATTHDSKPCWDLRELITSPMYADAGQNFPGLVRGDAGRAGAAHRRQLRAPQLPAFCRGGHLSPKPVYGGLHTCTCPCRMRLTPSSCPGRAVPCGGPVFGAASICQAVCCASATTDAQLPAAAASRNTSWPLPGCLDFCMASDSFASPVASAPGVRALPVTCAPSMRHARPGASSAASVRFSAAVRRCHASS